MCDIAANILARTPDERERIVCEAARQGLLETLWCGLRAMRVLFGIGADLGQISKHDILATISDVELIGMILRPEAPETIWPRRSALLWHLCDKKQTYLEEATWRLGADLADWCAS